MSQDIVALIAGRVSQSLKGKPADEKFVALFEGEDVRDAVVEFVGSPACRFLFFSAASADKLVASNEMPTGPAAVGKRKSVYFLKPPHLDDAVTAESLRSDVVCAELTSSALKNLSTLSHEVFYPLLQNPANRADWSGPTSKEVISEVNAYLSRLYVTVGQAEGRTLLPMPPPSTFGADVPEKERVHVLETAVVQWSQQVHALLRAESDALLRSGANPGPLAEVEFRKHKAGDLEGVRAQMGSDDMKRCMAALSQAKSQYAVQFQKVMADVEAACAEAAQNVRFLKALEPLFSQLADALDFGKLEELFTPLFHTMLLVWEHSTTYNTRARLQTLVQMCCNELINQALKNVSGESVFRHIDDENVAEAVRLLESTAATCEAFKDAFLRYKVQAATTLNDRSWDVPRDVAFQRLDSFLERCLDILEFTKIVKEYSRLERVNIGGTKGALLTETVRQIFADFTRAVEDFKELPYDIMDVTVARFDDDFFRFRSRVKSLERRLSSVITAAFDDCATISARFKLLEGFEGLLERPIIKDDLEKKHAVLLQAYTDDLNRVQEIFQQGRDSPRIDQNMPPVAGSLVWVRSLLERVEEPMQRLKALTLDSDREEAKEIAKVHRAITQQLGDYEAQRVESWRSEIDQTSEVKLQQPLLSRHAETRRLRVNFDDALVCLLREVKYFLLLKLEVPEAALSVFEQADTYRAQIGNLDLIVGMYNEMMTDLHRVERPLVERSILRIDEMLEQGLEELNWRSQSVNDFIASAMQVVRGVYDQVGVMKGNFASICKLMADFSEQPLAERKSKPQSPQDFEEHLEKTSAARREELARHMDTVKRLMQETNETLKVNPASPIWKAYVDHVEEHVRDGLAATIANSIDFFCRNFDAAELQKEGVMPLLEIKLGLYANDVLFNAEDTGAGNSMVTDPSGPKPAAAAGGDGDAAAEGKEGGADDDAEGGDAAAKDGSGGGDAAAASPDDDGAAAGGADSATDSAAAAAAAPAAAAAAAPKTRRDVWQIVTDWVAGFFEVSDTMRRLNGSSYVDELKNDANVVRCTSRLRGLLEENYKDCEQYRQEYIKFEFLWKTDRSQSFDEFLADATERARVASSAAEGTSGANKKKQQQQQQQQHDASAAGGGGDHDGGDQEDGGAALSDEVAVHILPLADFERQITQYKALQAEVAAKAAVVEQGWLKINAQPIKQALGTWVSRWIHTYTSYLYNHVTRQLNHLETMMKDVNDGLADEVPKGDSEKLKTVLGYIHQVKSQEKATMAMFQPLRDTVNVLKKHDKPLDEYELKLLSDAPVRWDATVNRVYKVKEQVNNLQNEEVDRIKEKVDNFEQEVMDYRQAFKHRAPFNYEVGVDAAYAAIYEQHNLITEMEQKAERLNDLERVFELQVSKHRHLGQCRLENGMLKRVWDATAVVKNQFEEWERTLWDRIDTDVLLDACKKLQKQINTLPKETRGWSAFQGLQSEVKNLLTVLPLVTLLHSPCMSERHWRELMTSTGRHFTMGPDFCLRDLLELELHRYVSDVEDIVELASKESKIATQLAKIEAAWADLELDFGYHKDTEIGLIKASEEVQLALEENMAQLQGMQAMGKYVEHFVDQVNKWQEYLGTVETVMYDWLDVQARWSSLESIFLGSKDIRVQLPEDSKRFDDIHARWVALMSSAREKPNVIESCSEPGRSELLELMKAGLEQCEKSLNQYLETKRKAFPRFYFLANAALLDILSNGYNPQAVQKHIGDAFDNIARLTFRRLDGETGDRPGDAEATEELFTRTAVGMHSKDGGEHVDFCGDFECEGPVEEWLNGLVTMMRDTLKNILGKAKFAADHWEIEKPRREWLFDYPAQIALTASQIIWTEEVDATFDAFEDGNEQAMKEYLKTVLARLESLIQLVLGKLNKRDRTKIITLITVDVHNRDVVQKLIDGRVQSSAAFAWQSQMRYEWRAEEQSCLVKVADATFDYSYEYVGNTGRLVITPLTDRCYITLTQALRLIMGGAPAGPAGTGKTETTKDLGRALGLPVYVFNCSEQMNVQSMGAVFKGLCQTGAWGCFDEFNRIPIEVLSVVATQFACVLNAVREGRSEFDFMGEVVRLVPTVGAFITMNPGYAGRTELPENLKALFRSCAMVVPDMELICENMLMSEGFLSAQRLSKKFVTLYSLSSELLSKQMHYDWGLRATKAVLRVAGSLKRGEPDVDEDVILMRALRDFNLPKLVDEDKPIFRQLVCDLFPGMGNADRKFNADLRDRIRDAALARGLQAEDMFVRKCVELAELLEIRHSVFVIGRAGTGKSEIWKTLFAAFNSMGSKTVTETINPKAVRNNELYGWLTKTDWYDGILSTVMRNMSRNNAPYNDTQKMKVIVLDGDIDPEWIESLNTVMDDNKVLTLVSNERIPVTAPMRLLFEISNLDNATPATVSRAGIIYINQRDVGSKPFLDSWIEARDNDKQKSSLLALFNKYMTPEYVAEMCKAFGRVVPIGEMAMIKTVCFLLEGLLERIKASSGGGGASAAAGDAAAAAAPAASAGAAAAAAEEGGEKEVFEANFVFAAIWAFGGALLVDKQADHRKAFSDWWKRVFTTVKFPKEGTVFDYYPDASGKMVPWAGRVPSYSPPADAHLVTKVFVPTVETVRMTYVMDLLVRRRRPVLMVGNAGTGKTTVVREYLASLDETYTSATINLNAYTDAKSLQAIMESYIDKRSGRVYGPEGNKRLVYFVDDLNMPFVDTYGTQSPSALMRQHLDYGTWYDTTKLEKKEVQDVQYIAAMNPTAGSFTVNDRLQGHFAVFGCQLPSAENLTTIYSAVMQHHFEPFEEAVRDMAPALVAGTIALHADVSQRFLPSSTKFHYQFNLRELSSICQGLCMSSKAYTPWRVVQLWRHEATRVLSDRLISAADATLFGQLLDAQTKKHFADVEEDEATKAAAAAAAERAAKAKADAAEAAEQAAAAAESGNAEAAAAAQARAKALAKVAAEDEGPPPPIFTSFTSNSSGEAGGPYVPVPSWGRLKEVLSARLEEHNETSAVMDLELFGMAMEHVCRIARIIENPRGNALLVGVGGSGKQSLARLASFLCGYDTFQIAVTQSYGKNDLKADLQDLYRKTGVKGTPVTFLLTDAQIVDDEWLVFINDLLSSGYIPDLFTAEDKDGIFSQLRNEAKAAGVPDTRAAMQEFFIGRVRSNLHVVLCFSPVGDVFRVRCRKFPSLINCTNIDWFHPWPRDALVSVASRFLQEVEDLQDEPEARQAIAEHMAEVHLTVNSASERYKEVERRFNYTTPKSFLELISFYKQLLEAKRAELQQQIERLEKGITTLQSTQKDVAELKEDLKTTLVKVEEKKVAAGVLIEKMGVERGKVEAQQAIAAVEAEKAEKVSESANKIREDCERDLGQAMPILEAAQEAVNCLTKASLTTLKSFANPPAVVLDVTKAVLIMLKNEKKNFSWAAAKKMMANVGAFMQALKDLDATTIAPDTIERLRPVLALDHFNAQSMEAVSSAAASLCNWVVNVVRYNEIYKNVAPKMAAQERAAGEFKEAQEKLHVVQDRVAAMEAKLAKLNESLSDAVNQRNEVEAEARRCTDRLALAERLVGGLADENTRWGNAVEEFEKRAVTLKGDVLLAAAFVSYIGAFNQSFRLDLWRTIWIPDLVRRNIPITEGVDPLSVLANESDFATWKNEGLPADRISLENGAIITQCARWPLMIDPQLQGIKWIKQREGDSLKVVQIGQKRWLNTIVQAVQNGDTVLIESIGEHLDATLDPILSRSTIRRGNHKFIRIGGEEVEYHPKFRLILQTKQSNPHYKPEIAAQCTLINFIVTEEGLEEQLLALVVNREKPELEERRTGLVRSINEYMVTLTDLENELLQRLSNAPDDILSDVSLIEGLEKTKEAATEIEQKVKEARQQEIDINKTRNEFRPVAAEGSWLYFLLIQLNVIDHMYQYSLDAFTVFFFKAMERATASDETPQRVAHLRESIRITIFRWVNRGLFEKHKLIFSNELCFKLMRKGALSQKFNAVQYDFLVRAPKKLGVENPLADWLPDAAWFALQRLVEIEGFEKLCADMVASPNRFKEWYNKARPEEAPLPLEWRKLDDQNPFMKLLILRATRNDRMTTAIERFVARSIPDGRSFTECDSGQSFLDVLRSSFADSTNTTPVFFVLSPGADPVSSVELIAKKRGMYDGKFHRVALGQGQDVVAMNRLEIGHKEGHWVVLENVELMPSWLLELEKKLDDFAAEGSHADFRVFLSAEPSRAIPIGLLERSIKLTNEPPQGLKANLKRAFATFDRDEFEFKDAKVKSILFGLCHFHSVIIERIKFGPKGWNRAYPFNTGDLMNSATVLGNYLADGTGDKIPWADLRYIFGEILYGGHITDDWDRLLCNTYLSHYMREELLDEMELFPFSENFADQTFRSPPVMPYDDYNTYVEDRLAFATPVAFGLHPNAEIGVRATDADNLFSCIMDLQPRGGGASGAGGGQSPQARVEAVLESISEKTGSISFAVEETAASIADERSPYSNVFLQECDRMNLLTREIRRSLGELALGLSGELQMSEKMDDLFQSLYLGRVPASWERLAYPSARQLGSWVDNLVARAAQLQSWIEEPTSTPACVQLNYLFNAQSYLTAIMQTTAQKNQMELDKLVIMTDVTRKTVEEIDSHARDGAYVSGLYMEGARWNWNSGTMEESLPREMYFQMPVINCRAVLSDKLETSGVYRCPVYTTARRGPTFVFTSTLRSKLPAAKWVLAGVVLVMEVADE